MLMHTLLLVAMMCIVCNVNATPQGGGSPSFYVFQPDGERITLVFMPFDDDNGDIGFYEHTFSSRTVIKDSVSGYWCYAEKGEDGWTKSSGAPITDDLRNYRRHYEKGRSVSDERFQEMRQNPSKIRFENRNPRRNLGGSLNRNNGELPWSVSPHIDNVKNIVIFIELDDQPGNFDIAGGNYVSKFNCSYLSLKQYYK
jgi:hypothetical protein